MTTNIRKEKAPDFDGPDPDWAALFPDEGCELAPHCLTCPLPRCRWDTLIRSPSPARIARNADIVTRVQHGEEIKDVARAVGLSPRRVWGIVQTRR